MSKEVMTTKKWLIYFLKFIIPFYNIYWLVICLIGKEDKVNENERNYMIASLIFGVIMSVIVSVIYIVLFIGLFSAIGMHNKTDVNKEDYNYEVGTEDEYSDIPPQGSYDSGDKGDDYGEDGTEDEYLDSTTEDNTDYNRSVSGNALSVAGNTYSMYGISFTSSLPLEIKEDSGYVELESDTVNIFIVEFEDSTVEDVKSESSVLQPDGSYLEQSDGYVEKYINSGSSCVEVCINYSDGQDNSAVQEILDSIK